MREGLHLRKIALELKDSLGIERKIHIRVKPMKRVLANINIDSGVIKLNRNFVKMLSEQEIRFVIAHELLHLKYGIGHPFQMSKELENMFSREVYRSVMEKALDYLRNLK